MNNFKYDELYQKYLNLLEENSCLKATIKKFEAESNIFASLPETFQIPDSLAEETWKTETDNRVKEELIENSSICGKTVNHYSVKKDKIALFMSLFKGRSDVYAKRWQNKKGQSGYSPAKNNLVWQY